LTCRSPKKHRLAYEKHERIEVIRQAYKGLFQLATRGLFDKYVDFVDVYSEISDQEQKQLRDIATSDPDHTYTDTALVWALRLTGLHDRDKFKALDWGLRTWDQWQLNDCDDRFGSDWPGRIRIQLLEPNTHYSHQTPNMIYEKLQAIG
jgi:hypothetical protein